MLPSGLPEHVGDDEDLARVLRHSSYYSRSGAKAVAFLPASDGATSVIRHGAGPQDELWKAASEVTGSEIRFGMAICPCKVVRQRKLEVRSDEPPARHANIVDWPVDPDPDLQKARRKQIALEIAGSSRLILVNG